MQRRIVMATTMFLVVMTVITGSIGLLNLTVGDSVQGMKMPPGVPMVMEHLITSAERHAAADRAAAARRGAQIMSGVSLVKTAIAPNEAHAATTTTDPKTPDYFGTSPNYANSPLPPNVIIAPVDGHGTGAEAIATVQTVVGPGGQISRGVITSIKVVNPGSGYTAPPQITIDPTISTVTDLATNKPIAGDGAGATAVATIDANGQLSAINVTNGGSAYGGIRKFVDSLPGLTAAGANTFGQYIQLGVPDTTTFPGSDYYEIGLVEYSQQFHSDLPASKLRGYVQLNDPATTYQVTRDASGKITGWPQPHYLGPTIVASRDTPVRIKFVNLLPTGTGGDLFIPMDNTVMGAGEGPTQAKDANGNLVFQTDAAGNPIPVYEQYTQNRATLHLHGGLTPWISDGTPHQWTTPAGETTSYPKGVSTQNVPDMPATGPGEMTFFYSNQQSARLMFYHDHAYGITRLNVYAGEAAGYLLTDQFEGALIKGGTATGATGASVTVPAGGVVPDIGIPLVIQDKTFVPGPKQLAAQDPTWNYIWRAGVTVPATGNLWMPHVYMTNQNPIDLSGTNAMGRWDYSQWFWPPTTALHPTVPNPYASATNPVENPDIPGINNPSLTPEAFMDTPIVNGVAYPYVKLNQQVYRFRILNACNDRSLNLQFYFAKSNGEMWDAKGNLNDPNAGEVDMVPATGPATPMGVIPPWPNDNRMGGVPNQKTSGPSWIQIGTEGGFLPAPVVLNNRPVGYENNLRNIVVTNVNTHTLMLAPAERADVIVDFSKVPAGSKLILYNDSPAPVPAFDPRYDYYTADQDQTDTGGAPTTLAGYGPNTRTIMQIQVLGNNSKVDLPNQPNPYKTYENDTTRMTALKSAINATFAASQDPIIVPEPAYNGVYGKTSANGFPAVLARIQNMSLTFTPNSVGAAPITIGMKPKAIQELFETQYGRMNATLGVEIPNTTGVNQTTIPLGYIDPATESIDDSVDAAAPLGTPQGTLADGTQIWKITHNGVDTHAIHFHLFNVQIINRVGWDGQVRLPDANELGWKDTVRMNPLEDAIVALRPIAAKIPFGTYQSIRPLDVTAPIGSTMGFWLQGPNGVNLNPPTSNTLYNFGDEYVWHCHLLGHEENDMMRPLVFNTLRAAPAAASSMTATSLGSGAVKLDWPDATPPTPTYGVTGNFWSNPQGEIGYRILRAPVNAGVVDPTTYVQVGTSLANQTTYTDSSVVPGTTYSYEIVTYNDAKSSTAVIGANEATATSGSVTVTAAATAAPEAPTNLTASFLTPALGVKLSWTAATGTVTSYTVTRSGGQNWPNITTTSYTDSTNVVPNTSYTYTVTAVNSAGSSPAATLTVLTLPDAPTGLASVASPTSAILNWNAPAGAITSYTVERSSNLYSWQTIGSASNTSYTDNAVKPNASYFYRVKANNATGSSAATAWIFVTVQANLPPAPTGLNITLDPATPTSVSLNWTSGNINIPVSSYLVERSTTNAGPWTQVGTPTTTSFVDTTATANTSYYYHVIATNPSYDPINSVSSAQGIVTLPNAATGLAGVLNASGGVDLSWTAPVGGADTYTIESSSDAGATWTTLATAFSGAALTYTDATAQANTTYVYRITAYNVTPAAGMPATSAPVVVPPTLPTVATNLTATVSASGVALSWTAPSGLVTSYRIDRQNSTVNGVTASGWQTVGTSTTPAFTDTGAAPNTLAGNTSYDYQVIAINTKGNGPASNPATALTLPDAPAPLAFAAIPTGVTVNWTTPAGNGTITGYTIDRSADGGANWTNLTSSAVNSSTAYNTYLDTSVLAANSNFVYRVSATNASGTGASASITALTVPAAPTNLNGAVNASGVLLTWTVPAGGVGTITGYTVERSDGQSWTTTGPGTSYTDSTTAAGNTTYTYTVKANNSSGSGPASAGKIILTLPGASTNLAATALSPVGVSLTWTPPSGNGGAITGYMVYRSTDNGATWAPANGTMTPGAPFIDTTAAANTNYAYGIIAYNATGAGPASAASNNVLSVPAAPSVSAVVQAGPQVVLTMVSTGGNGTITGYTIQRRTSATAAAGGRRAVAAGPWATIATVTTGTSYTDGTGLTLNASYDYQVSASNTPAGTTPVLYGAYSAALKVTATPPLPPTAPTNLTARASGANVVLSWRNNTTNQTSVIIERATSAATLSFTQIGTVAGTATTFTDATVAPTTTYVYQVRAVNAVGSTLSAQVTFTTPAPPLPTAPTRLRAAASGANVVLTWTNGTNQTNIVVQRANSGTTAFTTLATLGATATTYSDATAVQGTAYTYQVYATNAVGSSPMVQVTFTLPLAAPTGLVGTPNVRGAASKFVTLTWTNNAPAATGFIVERLVGAAWTAVAGTPTLVAGSTTSYTITESLTATGSYQYRVRAITATAASANATVTVRVQ